MCVLLWRRWALKPPALRSFSHGSKYAQGQDPKQYAQDRRVSIELFKSDDKAEMTASR